MGTFTVRIQVNGTFFFWGMKDWQEKCSVRWPFLLLPLDSNQLIKFSCNSRKWLPRSQTAIFSLWFCLVTFLQFLFIAFTSCLSSGSYWRWIAIIPVLVVLKINYLRTKQKIITQVVLVMRIWIIEYHRPQIISRHSYIFQTVKYHVFNPKCLQQLFTNTFCNYLYKFINIYRII